MAKLGNIRMINPQTGSEPTNVYGTINTYLQRKGQNSENTMKTYDRHIRDFFNTMRSKAIEDLTVEDIKFEKPQIEAYQVALANQYKGATVNNAITALKQCYKKLEDNGFPVKESWFDLERYDEHDSEKYDTLTHEEVLQIINLVSKTRKGKEKALLIRLAYATAFRKESILSMCWNQIINIDGQWYAKVLGKGNKWSHKKLSNDLYNTLIDFKNDAKDDAKIFQLTDKTIKNMMKYIREHMDFGHRNIVFHSLKKASLNEVNIITGGDLKAIQAQGDHSDVRTSLESYIANKKMEDLVTVDINTHIPVDKFAELSKDEMVNVFNNLDRNTQIKILRSMGVM